MGLARQGSYHAYTVREPVGVVGQIIPWNFPAADAAWKLGPAPPLAMAAASCSNQPSKPRSPRCRLGELIAEAGFPDGVVNIVPGYGENCRRRACSAHGRR